MGHELRLLMCTTCTTCLCPVSLSSARRPTDKFWTIFRTVLVLQRESTLKSPTSKLILGTPTMKFFTNRQKLASWKLIFHNSLFHEANFCLLVKNFIVGVPNINFEVGDFNVDSLCRTKTVLKIVQNLSVGLRALDKLTGQRHVVQVVHINNLNSWPIFRSYYYRNIVII